MSKSLFSQSIDLTDDYLTLDYVKRHSNNQFDVYERQNDLTEIAVDKLSCDFEAGTLTTLLGPSGCGKTTSLRIIAGLERATEGKILIDGEDKDIGIGKFF